MVGCNFPSLIACTDLCPDLVQLDEGKRVVTSFEWTIPFNTLLEEAKDKYADLVESTKRAGYRCNLIMIEVGSCDLINLPGFPKLKDHFHLPKKTMSELAMCEPPNLPFRLILSVCSRNAVYITN